VLHLLSDEKAQQWLYVAVRAPSRPFAASRPLHHTANGPRFSPAPQNKRNLRRVVALMIPGVTPQTLGLPTLPLSANLPFALSPPADASSSVPVFQSLFSHACPTKAPGEKNRMHSCYQAFTTTPLTGGEKDRREKARKESESGSGDRFATRWQQRREGAEGDRDRTGGGANLPWLDLFSGTKGCWN